MNSTTPITNFTAGEVSERFDGRVDIAKYFNACSTLENMVVFPLGGASRRMGLEYIGEVKDSANKVALLPFEFSVEQAYILEFGPLYMRIYQDGVLLESGGSPVEVTTPYTESDLEGLRFTQSADILFLVHPKHPPAEVSRTGATSWTYATTSFTSQPSDWGANNYPSSVTFFQQRLCYAGTPQQPQTIWMSKTSNFRNFTTGSAADDSIKITLDSDQVNAIRWMLSGRLLLIGTSGGEWSVGGSSTDASISPDNIQAQRQTTYGSNNSQAVLVSSSVVYLEAGGKRVREFAYLFEQDGYASPDLTLLADHVGRQSPFVKLTYAKRPDSMFWISQENGDAVSLTYQREEGIVAVARQDFGGVVESVAAIPGALDTDVYFVIRRTIDGATVRYIERMAPVFEDDTTNSDSCRFLDCHKLATSETPTSTFNGFEHLAGESVSVLADGATHPEVTVDGSGNITLTRDASRIVAGFNYVSTISPMRLEGGSPEGVAQTKKGRVAQIGIRFYKTLGAKFGGRLDRLDTIPFRDFSDDMGKPPALFTGDKTHVFPQGWNTDRYVYVQQDQPLPLTVLLMVPYVTLNR